VLEQAQPGAVDVTGARVRTALDEPPCAEWLGSETVPASKSNTGCMLPASLWSASPEQAPALQIAPPGQRTPAVEQLSTHAPCKH